MNKENVLDTAFDDPVVLGSEAAGLVFALERARAQFAWKVGGLDAAGLGKPHPPSTMTLGGLIKHVAGCEERMTARAVTGRGQPDVAPWDAVDHDADRDWEWRTAADDSPEELYRLWRDAVERSRAAWAVVLAAEGGLDQPATFTVPSGESPDLRRILIDTIEHYLRHLGHADLLREAVDGLVGEDPPS